MINNLLALSGDLYRSDGPDANYVLFSKDLYFVLYGTLELSHCDK